MEDKIRLSQEDVDLIKSLAIEIFGSDAEVWIFGSRVNPNLKGGDIDIYIEVSSTDKMIEKKLEYLVKLKDAIGEQKIDLIVKQKGCKEFICEEAKKRGIKL